MIDLDAIRRKADMDNIQGYISLDALQTIRGLIDEVERLRKELSALQKIDAIASKAAEIATATGQPVSSVMDGICTAREARVAFGKWNDVLRNGE